MDTSRTSHLHHGDMSILLLLDLLVDFNILHHNILLGWFLGLGVGDIVPYWFTSIFSSCSQAGLMGGWRGEMSVAPQGLTLFCLLFNIYMKPQEEVTLRSSVWYHQYAVCLKSE